MDFDKVQIFFCKENGLPKYMAFKQAFARTNQALANNLKGKANGTELAIDRQLFHLRRKL